MKYIVQISYRKFVFCNGKDALAFAETAVKAQQNDDEVTILIELEAIDAQED